MTQTPFLPWGLPYQQREPPARREPYEHAAQTHAYRLPSHTHLEPHTHCKDEERTDFRDHYGHHRCSSYTKCSEDASDANESREEAVSSSAEHHTWGDKLVSSSVCSTSGRAEAPSPPQMVTTTHTGGPGRRGALQLWQFLVALLAEGARCVAWTGRGLEFKLHEPEEVARRWGAQKNRPAMNYDKLSRSLRYYYEKGIMQKVAGGNGQTGTRWKVITVANSRERYVYKFVCDPEALFSMARTPNPAPYEVLSQLYYPQYLPPSTPLPNTEYQRRYYPDTQYDG